MELASVDENACVLMSTSCDMRHRPEFIFENEKGYFITTGGFPQEVVIQLGKTSTIRSIDLVSMGIGKIEVSSCDASYANRSPSPVINTSETKYEPYYKMLNANLSRDAVVNRMEQDGLRNDEIDKVLKAQTRDRGDSLYMVPDEQGQSGQSGGGEHKYAKYIKLLNAKQSEATVEQKMRADGVKPEDIEFFILNSRMVSTRAYPTQWTVFCAAKAQDTDPGEFQRLSLTVPQTPKVRATYLKISILSSTEPFVVIKSLSILGNYVK